IGTYSGLIRSVHIRVGGSTSPEYALGRAYSRTRQPRATTPRDGSPPRIGFDLLELQRRDDPRLQALAAVEARAHRGAVDALAPRPLTLASSLGDRRAHQFQDVIFVQQRGLVLLHLVHDPISTQSLSPAYRTPPPVDSHLIYLPIYILQAEFGATVSHAKLIPT